MIFWPTNHIKNKKFSLVLGWGAARGVMHVGVWKYLQEHDLTPAEVVGTSIGAIIWAGIAQGRSREDLRDLANDFSKEKLKVLDLRMKNGVFKGNKIKKYLESVFWDQKIQNLAIPLKVTSVDIENSEIFLFEQWKLVDALRATMSLPAIVEPYKYENKVLVDGGIIANLPIQYATHKKVLAVSMINQDIQINLKDKALPNFKTGVLGINFSLLQKCIQTLVMQNELRSIETSNKDIVLVNPVHDFSLTDFSRVDEMIEFGYQAAKKALA